jgi:hypothetical protein
MTMKKIFILSLVAAILIVPWFFKEKLTFGAPTPVLKVQQGGTGAATLTGCLQGNGTGPITGTGVPCGSGSGGSGGGTWATTTSTHAGRLINYPNNTTDIVTIGSNSTTTAEFYFDPNTLIANLLGRLNFQYASGTGITLSGPSYLSSLSQGFLYTGSNGLIQPVASSSVNLSWFNNDSGFLTSYTSPFEIATTSSISVPGLAYFTKTSGRTTLGSVATTSVSCSGSVSCTSFNVLGSAPITITGSSGSGASTTLLADFNTWTGRNNFTYASSTGFSTNYASSTLLNVGGDSLVVGSDGKVGVGSSTPTYTLSIGSSNTGTFGISTTTNGCVQSTNGLFWITGTACGSGSGTSAFEIATSSSLALSQVAYISQVSGRTTLASVATTTVTASSPLSLSNPVVKLGGSNSVLSLDTSGAWSGSAGSVANALTAGTGLSSAGTYNGSVARTFSLDLGNANIWTGLQTFTNSSTTLGSFLYASTTNLFGAGLTACDPTTGKLTWSNGIFGCGTDQTGGGGFSGAGNSIIVSNSAGNALTATSSNPLYVGSLFATSSSLISNLRGMATIGTTTQGYRNSVLTLGATTTGATGALLTGLNDNNTSSFDFYKSGYAVMNGSDPYWDLYETDTAKYGGMYMSGGNLRIYTDTGSIRLNNNLDLQGVFIESNIVPSVASSYDIGSASNPWLNMYLSTSNCIYFNNKCLIGGELGDTLALQDPVVGGSGRVGISTTTAKWPLEIASTTTSQLTLSGGLGPYWSFRGVGGSFYLATSSPSTLATSTVSAITINSDNVVRFGNPLATCIALTGSADLCDGNDATGGGSAAPAFDPTAYGAATTTTLGFLNGLFSTASSTFSSNLFLSSLGQGSLYTGSNGLVNIVATSTPTVTAPITYSGTLGSFLGGVAGTFDCTTANASTKGCISGADFSKFNSATTTFSTGLTYTGATNAVTVNTSQNISTLSNLTGNGAILTSGGTGALGTYAGTSCTNQFVRSLNGSIVATCATVANTDLANSTISGISLGSNLADLTATNGTLTFSGTYNGGTARTIGLNLGNANTWTALQTFGNASSTLFSTNYASSTQYFGAGLQTCDPTTGKLTWSNGVFSCGTDQAGSGGSAYEIATTSDIAQSQVAYISSVSGRTTLASVATTTLATGNGLSVSGTLGFQLGGSNSTISINSTGLSTNGLVTWNGTNFIATGTPQLTIGTLLSTSTATSTFAGRLSIGTTTPNSQGSATFTVKGLMDKVAQFFTSTGTKIMEIADSGLVTLLGVWDFGGATSVEIPNGTAPVFSAAGQIGFDTTDEQFLIGTTTANTPGVLPLTQKLWSATIASTSQAFIGSGVIPLPPLRDGVVITEIHCYVRNGTSKIIRLSNAASSADTDSLTCGTTLTSDTAMSQNYILTAGEIRYLELGATSGAVDEVTFSVWGKYTRE